MTVSEKTWRETWGNFNWKKISPTEIDEAISKGNDPNMVIKKNYPLGYEHTNPLIESLKADNPVVFSHLIKSGADLNFRLPYVNLYPDGGRYGVHSVVTESPNLIYIKYAQQRGLEVIPEDILDVLQHKGKETERKLSFLVDFFEKKGNSKESLKVLSLLPQIGNEDFTKQHFPLLLKNVKTEDALNLPETLKTERLFKNQILRAMRDKAKAGITPHISVAMQRTND